MKNKMLFRIAALIGICAVGAFAQLVDFTITSPGSNVMGYVYASPYSGTVNGAAVKIICDDFNDHVLPPDHWTAYATKVSELDDAPGANQNVYFNTDNRTQQLVNYIAVAMLAIDIMASYQNDPSKAGQLSYALWGVFAPTLLNSNTLGLTTGDFEAAKLLRTNALSAAAGADVNNYANVTIYTPWVNGQPDTAPRPQEMVVVSMPEASSVAIFGVDLLALAGLVFFVRRRAAKTSV